MCNKDQQNAQFLYEYFNLSIVFSTYFEHPSVHPQEDLYMQFYAISFMRPYKQQSGRWQDVLSTSCHRPDCCLYGRMKEIA